MSIEEAKCILRIHADFTNKNEKSLLYCLKSKKDISLNLFIEIIEAMEVLSDKFYFKEMDGEIVKNIYSIIFGGRSWLGSGMLENSTDKHTIKKISNYIQIMEEILYYLILGNKEEAFWSYSEFLDGRY